MQERNRIADCTRHDVLAFDKRTDKPDLVSDQAKTTSQGGELFNHTKLGCGDEFEAAIGEQRRCSHEAVRQIVSAPGWLTIIRVMLHLWVGGKISASPHVFQN
jgi:hypothetical protein